MARIKSRLQQRVRILGIILGWGTAYAAYALTGIFQGTLVAPPWGPSLPGGGGGGAQVPVAATSLALPRVPAVQSVLDLFQTPVLGIPLGRVIFFLEIIGTAILASFLLEDAVTALLSFLFSYGLGAVIVYVALIAPLVVGSFRGVPDSLFSLGTVLAFNVFFPIPLIFGLIGTWVGVLLASRFC